MLFLFVRFLVVEMELDQGWLLVALLYSCLEEDTSNAGCHSFALHWNQNKPAPCRSSANNSTTDNRTVTN